MTIASDATAIILLSKAGVLELFASRNAVVMAKSVYLEVLKGKEKGRLDAMLAQRLVRERRLRVLPVHKPTRSYVEGLLNIKKGELDTVALAYKNRYAVLTDDKKCINAAKALGLPFMNSLDAIVAMWKNKAINSKGAMDCINLLEDFGWYSKELIKTRKEMIR